MTFPRHIYTFYVRKHWNHLIDETSRNLQLELKGLVAQQYTKIKQEIKSMYDKNHGQKIYRKRKKLLERGIFEYKSNAFKFK